MNVVFYHEIIDSVIKGWKEGLEDCGFNNLFPVSKPISRPHPLDFVPDLRIIENPGFEFDLDIQKEIKAKKTVCIISEYKEFFKNYPFVDLWVESCFRDDSTEKAFSVAGLPFHYNPPASQESLIPLYTELYREFDLSIDVGVKQLINPDFKVVPIPEYAPHPEVIYGNTKVNYNYVEIKPGYVNLNQKAFDICFSGNFELCNVPEVQQIFESKVGYTSETDFNDTVKYFVDNEELRTRSAIKAYEVCTRNHTYTMRMLNLLKKLKLI
jgi:hypothetical protein